MRVISLRPTLFLVASLLLTGQYPARAATGISYLGEQADLILVGDGIAAPSTTDDGAVVFRIRWDSILKGEIPNSPFVEAKLEAPQMGDLLGGRDAWNAELKTEFPEVHGLWFLKHVDGAVYTVVRRTGRSYGRRDALIELPKSWVSPSGADLDRTLLSAARESYRFSNPETSSASSEHLLLRSLEYVSPSGSREAAWEVITVLMYSGSPEERDLGTTAAMSLSYRDPDTARLIFELESLQTDERMILAAATRDAASRDAALAVVDRLMNSAVSGDRTIGVALGLQLSDDRALERLSSELDSLGQDRNFGRINFNLRFLYRRPPRPFEHELWIAHHPTEPDPLVTLVSLIERRSRPPGLDAAIAGTLYRIMKRHDISLIRPDLRVDKKVLPAAALLLESPDPRAKQEVNRLFHTYGAFTHSGAGNQQPSVWMEERRRFSGTDEAASADDRAAFWLQWWSENREKLGFGPAKDRRDIPIGGPPIQSAPSPKGPISAQ